MVVEGSGELEEAEKAGWPNRIQDVVLDWALVLVWL